MLEQVRRTREEPPPAPSGLGGFSAPGDDAGGPVSVSNGPYLEELPVGGMPVGVIRARFRDRLDIDPQSRAIVDGREVGDDTVVRAGQYLMFAHRAGEKGRGE